MEITVKRIGDWQRVADATRMTVGKVALGHEPTDKFKRKILYAEHSPIRLIEFDITIKDVPFYVMGHLVRHHAGCEKFVRTSREDRTYIPRDERKQTDLVDMQFTCNAQSLIDISRRRLCSCADHTTRQLWQGVVDKVREIEPLIAEMCVPNCVYRGFCPEITPCRKDKMESFGIAREGYIYRLNAARK